MKWKVVLMSLLVYIVIVNYNNYYDTIECIRSLNKIDYNSYRIVIVDNNSTNNSEQILRKTFPQYKIIQTGANLGFAGGNNIGIKEALASGAEYILLLNNDTTVEKDFLNKMIECFERNPEAGVVGGKILNYNNKDNIEYAGGHINFFKFISVHDDFIKVDIDTEVGFITGCLMLIKSETIKKVGLLSEDYFMYYEDTDFCTRVAKAGYKMMYTPEAVVYHKVSRASGEKESAFTIKWNIRNRLIFMNKNKHEVGTIKFFLSCLYFYTTRIVRYFFYLMKSDKERAKAIIEGINEGRKYIRLK